MCLLHHEITTIVTKICKQEANFEQLFKRCHPPFFHQGDRGYPGANSCTGCEPRLNDGMTALSDDEDAMEGRGSGDDIFETLMNLYGNMPGFAETTGATGPPPEGWFPVAIPGPPGPPGQKGG